MMYLAFKWLLLMAVVMWALLCSVDIYLKRNKEILCTGFNVKPTVFVYKNSTVSPDKPDKMLRDRFRFRNQHRRQTLTILHYITFFAGALVVTLYNRKAEIIRYTKVKLANLNFCANAKWFFLYLYLCSIPMRVAIIKKLKTLWESSKRTIISFDVSYFLAFKRPQNRNQLNHLLLKRLREVGQERNNLGQLLIAAIQENKDIRLQCQLENLAKNRLLQQIKDTQKQIKENRSKYVNFQQLYLVTHQENIFLKSRIKKLTSDKEEAVNNFLTLINEVCQSTDIKLKTYCSNLIGNNKNKLLAFDANVDLRNDLQKTSTSMASSSDWSRPRKAMFALSSTKSLPSTSISDLTSQDMEIVPLTPEEPKPKLRGLPGEYVWTVKDRDGIIEKLYEYDYGYDFDNGDTIRRIRQYSVYHDKDCLLDFSNSRSTTIFEKAADNAANANVLRDLYLEYPFHRNFLTNSPVFQKFLQNNNNMVVATSMSPAPPLLCG